MCVVTAEPQIVFRVLWSLICSLVELETTMKPFAPIINFYKIIIKDKYIIKECIYMPSCVLIH